MKWQKPITLITLFLTILYICRITKANEASPVIQYSEASPLILLRAEANENTTLIDLSVDGGTSKPTNAVRLPHTGKDMPVNALVFYFCGGPTYNKTFGFKLWGWKPQGMAELICEGVGTIGTQAVVKYPDTDIDAPNRFWAKDLHISSEILQYHVSDCFYEDCSEQSKDACAHCAKLYGDNAGYEWIYCEIIDADGISEGEAGWISVYYSYF